MEVSMMKVFIKEVVKSAVVQLAVVAVVCTIKSSIKACKESKRIKKSKDENKKVLGSVVIVRRRAESKVDSELFND